MSHRTFRLALLALVAAGALPATAAANDFPTVARVEYVIGCMQEAKVPPTEAMYKCSCTIDAIADKLKYDEWTELVTLSNAIPMAGERGGQLRDLKDGRQRVNGYRKLQADARRSCLFQRD